MIDPTPGWHAAIRSSGLVLTPPEGAAAGSIVYREQLRPLARVADVVRAQAAPAGWRAGRLGEVERLLTVEAEHAAVVTESGTLDGAPVERTFGLVFGDDFYSLAVGLARGADQLERFRAEVRRLIQSDTYLLGTRRRRFVHRPPPGWQGFFSGALHTTWIPLDYPRSRGLITVHPALPVPSGERDYAEAFVDLVADRMLPADREVSTRGLVTAASGLSGTWWEAVARGGEQVHDLVVLEDDRYVYPLALESAGAERGAHLPTFSRLIDSVEPIPRRPRAATRAVEQAFSMWTD